jgi:transposase
VILIQTRWHEDDLAGRILAEVEKEGRRWRFSRCRPKPMRMTRLGGHPGNISGTTITATASSAQPARRPLAAPAFGWREHRSGHSDAQGTTGHPAHDAEKYKWRHLVENFFCALKAFRRIATRYEKTDTCFAAMINLVAAVLWTR